MATNNLTAQSVVLDLLHYIGVTGFTAVQNEQSLNQPGLDDVDTRRALAAVNSGLQTVQKWGPQDFKYARRSADFVAPITLSLTVANGSKIAVASVPPAVRNKGCSILIAGDTDLNRIMDITSNTNVNLLRAYLGTGAAGVPGTVYCDCVALADDVQAVAKPVYGTNNIELVKARDIDDFERIRIRSWCHINNAYLGTIETITTAIGIPVRWITERQRNGVPFLRIAPMPPLAFNATFQAKLRAERITATVLDTTGVTDPGYYFTSLNDDEIESLLLPIARHRFIAGHPSVKNAETRAAVQREYDEVMAGLKNGTALESAVPDDRAVYI